MRYVLTSSVSALAFIVFASAAVAAPQKGVETVVVTATRTAQPLSRTGLSVSVITAADLERQQTIVLSDALRRTPGIAIIRNGPVGGITTMGIRGSDSGQTVWLFDGVRLNDISSTDGQPLLSDVIVNNIQRVEILRGSQSTLYGSDAIGGVINVITKRGGDEPISLKASAEGGSFGTYNANGAVNGTFQDLEYGAAVNYLHTAGISASLPSQGNTERDGYRNFGATANLRYNFTDAVSLDLRGYYTDARNKYDGFPAPAFTFKDTQEYGRNSITNGYAGVNVALFDGKLNNRLAVLYSDTDRRGLNPVLAVPQASFSKSHSFRFEYQGVFDLDENNQITFGAETFSTYFRTGTTPAAAMIRGANTINGFYGQWQTTLFDQLTLTGGVRYDDDDQYGSHTSLKFAGAWALFDGGTILRANYGDGFKSPSLYQRYSQYSNPLVVLDPETSTSYEFGFDQFFLDRSVKASATYFNREAENQIDFFSCFGIVSPSCALRATQGGYYYNVKKSRASGLEALIAVNLTDDVEVKLNYTSVSAKNLTANRAMARRPHDIFNGGITWTPTEALTFGMDLTYTGKQFDDVANTRRMPGYLTVDVTGAYKLDEHFELYGRIENLADADYQPVFNYNAAGRAFYAGIRAGL